VLDVPSTESNTSTVNLPVNLPLTLVSLLNTDICEREPIYELGEPSRRTIISGVHAFIIAEYSALSSAIQRKLRRP
jgi:hypothetical protein